MNLSRRWIWIAGLSVIFVSTVSGQAGGPVTAPPPPGFAAVGGTVPPVGDPAVFFMFLRYYDSLVQDLHAHSDDVDQSFRSDADQNGAKRRRTSLSVK